MTGFSPERDRKVIPRWRNFDSTSFFGELDSVDKIRKHRNVTANFLTSKISNWHLHQTALYAADALGAAIVLGREQEVAYIANFLLGVNEDKWSFGKELAKRVLNPTYHVNSGNSPPTELEKSEHDTHIRTFRQLLQVEPKDPITWVELSRVYVTIGLHVKATECMNVALHLARDDRFILRSACRLWIHLDDPEKAHHIITHSSRTKYDPWLLAAELATRDAANKTPKYIKISRRILNEKRFKAGHLSELASALATIELNSGNIKHARRLFAQSLEHPTENSIAQAAWVDQTKKVIKFDDSYLDHSNTYEAGYQTYYKKNNWKRSIEQCRLWQYDQPFSRVAGHLGSYLAAVTIEDYSSSKRFAEHGLRANPYDSTLLNNLAFALINLGDTDKAESTLSKISLSEFSNESQIAIKATKGLLRYRTGEITCGRKLYLEAIEDAQKLPNKQLLAHARANYAMEELSIMGTERKPEVQKALHDLESQKDPISMLLRDRLTRASNLAQS